MDLLNRLWTALILNLLWLFCCLPVVTIGAATCAFYETARKRLLKGDGYLFSTFFRAFKSNFRQATILGLLGILMVAAGIAIFMLAYELRSSVLYIVLLAEAVFCICLFLWSIPLAARFKNKILQHFRNGLLLGLGHLWSTLLLLIGLVLTGVGIFLYSPLVLVLPVTVMTVWAHWLERVFKKHGFVEKTERAED